MTILETSLKRPPRIARTPEFKSHLVSLTFELGASVTSVANAHAVSPNLLRRWVRQASNSSSPAFLPVPFTGLNAKDAEPSESNSNQIEVNLERADLRIQFKIATNQTIELAHVLREVLR
jgi:transposase-like protein